MIQQEIVAAWWDEHRAIKSDIMRIVVDEWTMGSDRNVIEAHVRRYLASAQGWLPCPAGEFVDTYFDDFWPIF